MAYVDGFLLAVPKSKLDAYRRIAPTAGRIWREHGALEYRECASDDLKAKMGVPFWRVVRLKARETAGVPVVHPPSQADARERAWDERASTPRSDVRPLDVCPFRAPDLRRAASR